LGALSGVTEKMLIADLVSVISSIDLVLGEVDR